MHEGRLRELLARLREHLSSGAPVRDSEREQLDKAMNSIGGGPEASSPGALLRLERLAVRFEVSHPALAETLREIIDTLGKGGI
ncbi:MAG TPA: DUF4404 family protein [Steroidobacteraceae bacterium]|nr:DUF4404 family protein [Steroidobacteraceae bacterium]